MRSTFTVILRTLSEAKGTKNLYVKVLRTLRVLRIKFGHIIYALRFAQDFLSSLPSVA